VNKIPPQAETTAAADHIDTDMGVDDGLALMVADALLPDISAISCVFGNVPVETAIRNALLSANYWGGATAGACGAAPITPLTASNAMRLMSTAMTGLGALPETLIQRS
jgi:inosine-uridine nucleoside N-ribohydrolase